MGSVHCTWVREGERLRLTVANVRPSPTVSDVVVEPLPAAEVARELVAAWQAGSRPAIRALSERTAAAEAIALLPGSSAAWSFERCGGAAGSVMCRWSADGTALTVRVSNTGNPSLVTEVRLEDA